MEEDQGKLGTYFSRFSFLEALSKASLLFIGLSYAFGFIIVNSCLGSLGIVSTSILKAKYISAGVIFLLFVLLSGIILYPVVLVTSKWRGQLNIGDAFYSAGSLVILWQLLLRIAPGTVFFRLPSEFPSYQMIICLASLILFVITSFVNRLARASGPLFFVGMGIFAYNTFDFGIIRILGVLLIMAIITGIFISDFMKLISKRMPLSGMAVSTMLIISLSLSLCQGYGLYLYPKILNEFGGGKPLSINLILSESEKSGIGLLFEGKQKSTRTIEDVTLIDEDDNYFFIQKQDSQQIKTIRIKKSLVNTVIHHKK